MDPAQIGRLHQRFEESVFEVEGVEFWFARDLQLLLEYSEWRNFSAVIDKAKAACKTSGQEISDHFVDVNNMVEIGSGTERPVEDIRLTRYACYLIAQNGDPRKTPVAFAQTYFALQTRKQEVLEERLRLQERIQAREKLTASETELSKNIYQRGVDQKGFGRIRSQGDEALFGGYTTQQMKSRLEVPNKRPLADFLPTVTIAAKNLATEITNHNVQRQNLHGEPKITSEHVANNQNVRKLLKESGIQPESLPAEEDIKKLERRVKAQNQEFISQSKPTRRNLKTDA